MRYGTTNCTAPLATDSRSTAVVGAVAGAAARTQISSSAATSAGPADEPSRAWPSTTTAAFQPRAAQNRNVATASSMRPRTAARRSRSVDHHHHQKQNSTGSSCIGDGTGGSRRRSASSESRQRDADGEYRQHRSRKHRHLRESCVASAPQLCRQCSLLRRANLRRKSWHRRIGTAVRQQLIIWGPAATMVLHVIVPS